MAIQQIDWNDGSGGKIYLSYSASEGDQNISVSSDANMGSSPRSKTINFSTCAGSPSRIATLIITQQGKPNYFWTKAVAAGTFTLKVPSSVTAAMLTSISYSLDGGTTWITTNNDGSGLTITTPSISAGDKVLWKGIGTKLASAATNGNYSYFRGSANYNIGGDIASLLSGDSCSLEDAQSYAFARLFDSDTKLINAEELIMTPLTVRASAYIYIFRGCTNLVTAPTINATTCNGSYPMDGMFYGCSKLVVAPELKVATLSRGCFEEMFQGCTSLTTPPPELIATSSDTIRNYYRMFYGCTKLTTAPVIRLQTLPANACYQMFYNCKALSYIKCLATNISANNALTNWVYSVPAMGTFVKNPATTWPSGASGIPTGWTVETASS